MTTSQVALRATYSVKNRLGVCKTPISLTRNRASCGREEEGTPLTGILMLDQAGRKIPPLKDAPGLWRSAGQGGKINKLLFPHRCGFCTACLPLRGRWHRFAMMEGVTSQVSRCSTYSAKSPGGLFAHESSFASCGWEEEGTPHAGIGSADAGSSSFGPTPCPLTYFQQQRGGTSPVRGELIFTILDFQRGCAPLKPQSAKP